MPSSFQVCYSLNILLTRGRHAETEAHREDRPWAAQLLEDYITSYFQAL